MFANVSDDKKTAGSIHMALGDTVSPGGRSPGKTHIDGIMGYPGLWIVDKQMNDCGQLLITY